MSNEFMWITEDVSMNKDDLDRLIEETTKAIQQYPNNALAYNNCGVAYYYKGDNRRAIDYFNCAVLHDQNPVITHYNLGFAWFDFYPYDMVIHNFTKAISLKTRLPTKLLVSAFYRRGLACYRMSLLAQAIADLEEALRLDPSHIDAKQVLKNAQKDIDS